MPKKPRFDVPQEVVRDLRAAILDGQEDGTVVFSARLLCPTCPRKWTPTALSGQGLSAKIVRDVDGKPWVVVSCPKCGLDERTDVAIPLETN
jgi:predicted nucleic-acid-binding Zn-ribbon protein